MSRPGAFPNQLARLAGGALGAGLTMMQQHHHYACHSPVGSLKMEKGYTEHLPTTSGESVPERRFQEATQQN